MDPAASRPHIIACVCTYRRPELLRRLLSALAAQCTGDRFTVSVVVADNDVTESARAVVERFAAAAAIAVRYCVEPRRNIALARNRAVEEAEGDFIALIDDDEEPSPDWLARLLDAIELHRADGVLGPVLPRFDQPPPEWIVRGQFFTRPALPTGTPLAWKQTRAGNVLLRREVIADPRQRFDPTYGGGGEDVDFFRRAIARGRRFVWCAEAPVQEAVPPERCTRSYLLGRALRRGRSPYNQEPWPVAVSLVAIPTYAAALPIGWLVGRHVFMRWLVSACDHVGRIVALLTGRTGTVAQDR